MLHRVIWGLNGCCRQACREHCKKLLKKLPSVLFEQPSKKNNCPKSKHTEITNKLERQTEPICITPALLGFGFFISSSIALGRRENIFFIRNPARSNWNLRIHITPYDQEHLLSSQAQQGRGKNHSRFEKRISSKCWRSEYSSGNGSRAELANIVFWFAFLLAFLIKESAVFVCLSCVNAKLCRAEWII